MGRTITKPYRPGATFAVRATGGASNGLVVYQVTQGTHVVSVDKTSGLVTMLAPGTASITATKLDRNAQVMATAVMEVVITAPETEPGIEPVGGALRPKHARPQTLTPSGTKPSPSSPPKATPTAPASASHLAPSSTEPPARTSKAEPAPIMPSTTKAMPSKQPTSPTPPPVTPAAPDPTATPAPPPKIRTTSAEPTTASPTPPSETAPSTSSESTALAKRPQAANSSWTFGVAAAVVVATASLLAFLKKRL